MRSSIGRTTFDMNKEAKRMIVDVLLICGLLFGMGTFALVVGPYVAQISELPISRSDRPTLAKIVDYTREGMVYAGGACVLFTCCMCWILQRRAHPKI